MLIELDGSEGQAAQPLQAGEAGAKIFHREAHVERAERGNRPQGAIAGALGQCLVLGDLERQPLRRDLGAVQGGSCPEDAIRPRQRGGGEIERH